MNLRRFSTAGSSSGPARELLVVDRQDEGAGAALLLRELATGRRSWWRRGPRSPPSRSPAASARMPRPEVFSERKSSSMMTIGKRKRSMGGPSCGRVRKARSVGPAKREVYGRSMTPAGATLRRTLAARADATEVDDGLAASTFWWVAAGVAGRGRARHRHLLPADDRARPAPPAALAAHVGLGADRAARRRRARRRRRDRALALAARAPAALGAPARERTATSTSTSASASTSTPGPPTAPRASATAARPGPRALRRRAHAGAGEHVVVAVEGNWLVLAPAPLTAPELQPARTSHGNRRLVIAVIAAIFIVRTFKIVPQQHAWVVERLGKYDRTLTPGLKFVVPVHRARRLQALAEGSAARRAEPGLHHAGQHPAAGRRHPLLPGHRPDARELRLEQLHRRDHAARADALRSVIGKMELDKTFEERDHINAVGRRTRSTRRRTNWGVKVLRYEIKDLTPPAAILHAMQAQITAEREKRALIAASEGRQAGADQHRHRRARGLHRALRRRRSRPRSTRRRARRRRSSRWPKPPPRRSARSPRRSSQPGGEQAVQLKVAEQAVEAYAQLAQKNNTMIVPGNMSEVSALIGTRDGADASAGTAGARR